VIAEIVLALGLVAVIEGLVLVVAPRRMEDALRTLTRLPVDVRRYLGLLAMAIGVLVVWVARSFLG